jgi:hypothetical protein
MTLGLYILVYLSVALLFVLRENRLLHRHLRPDSCLWKRKRRWYVERYGDSSFTGTDR